MLKNQFDTLWLLYIKSAQITFVLNIVINTSSTNMLKIKRDINQQGFKITDLYFVKSE